MNHPKAKFDTWTFDEPVKSLSVWNPLSDVDLCKGTHNNYIKEAEAADLVFVCHRDSKLEGGAASIDDELDGALSKVLEEITANAGDSKAGSMTPTLRTAGGKFVLLCLGEPADIDGHVIGKAIATKCTEEDSPNVHSAVVLLPTDSWFWAFGRDMATSFYSSLYVDNRFRGTLQSITKPKICAKHLKKVSLAFFDSVASDEIRLSLTDETTDTIEEGRKAAEVTDAIIEGRKIAEGVHLAKDIVNAPHNVMNSLSLADIARKIASESNGSLTCQILDKDECEKRGMGAYLGVARASETPPQFIHLKYTPPESGAGKNKVIGIVGKGLLFDTGGYNIKTAMMELMKCDCGGAAAVLGAAKTIGALKPEGVECHFVIAACENMISGKGYVPSDILVASNGVTIEIINTDAEGRLTLADALVYCDKELNCEKIIELSTLTGSCMVALGKEVCGVFTQNEDLAKELEEVSKTTGEQSWRLPLVKSYKKQLQSKIADITNCGTRYGGAITAGLFLQHFVDTEKVSFAHIDIAGPAWDDSGATGFGCRLVTEWIRSQK